MRLGRFNQNKGKGLSSFIMYPIHPDQGSLGNTLKSTTVSEYSLVKENDNIEVNEIELMKLAKTITPEEKEHQILETHFPVSLDQFWNIYFGNKATYSFQDFHEFKKQKDFKVTKWEKVKVEENKGEKIEKLKREFNMTVGIKGVPFCSSSRCLRDCIVIKSGNTTVFESQLTTPDVPYGNYFYLKERWVIGSTIQNGNKVFLKVFISINMLKSTIFKGSIQTR